MDKLKKSRVVIIGMLYGFLRFLFYGKNIKLNMNKIMVLSVLLIMGFSNFGFADCVSQCGENYKVNAIGMCNVKYLNSLNYGDIWFNFSVGDVNLSKNPITCENQLRSLNFINATDVDEVYNLTCNESMVNEIREILCDTSCIYNASLCNETLIQEIKNEILCNRTFLNESLWNASIELICYDKYNDNISMLEDIFTESLCEGWWDEFFNGSIKLDIETACQQYCDELKEAEGCGDNCVPAVPPAVPPNAGTPAPQKPPQPGKSTSPSPPIPKKAPPLPPPTPPPAKLPKPNPAKIGAAIGAKAGVKIGEGSGEHGAVKAIKNWRGKIGAKVGPKVGAKVGPKIGKKVGAKVGPKIGGKIGPKIGGKIAGKIGPKIGGINFTDLQYTSYCSSPEADFFITTMGTYSGAFNLSENDTENLTKLMNASARELDAFYAGLVFPSSKWIVSLVDNVEIDDNIAKTNVGKVLLDSDLKLKDLWTKYACGGSETCGNSAYLNNISEKWNQEVANSSCGFKYAEIDLVWDGRVWVKRGQIKASNDTCQLLIKNATLDTLIDIDNVDYNVLDTELYGYGFNYNTISHTGWMGMYFKNWINKSEVFRWDPFNANLDENHVFEIESNNDTITFHYALWIVCDGGSTTDNYFVSVEVWNGNSWVLLDNYTYQNQQCGCIVRNVNVNTKIYSQNGKTRIRFHFYNHDPLPDERWGFYTFSCGDDGVDTGENAIGLAEVKFKSNTLPPTCKSNMNTKRQIMENYIKNKTDEMITIPINNSVNYNRSFEELRSVYYALIQAQWYKDTQKNGIFKNIVNTENLSYVETIETNKSEYWNKFLNLSDCCSGIGGMYFENLSIVGEQITSDDEKLMSNATYKTIEINNNRALIGSGIMIPHFDIYPASIDVKDTVEEGEIVEIKANITNIGNANLNNVSIIFYSYDLLRNYSYVINETRISLNANSSIIVSATWNTTLESGSRTIYVVVDPYDEIAEAYEGDNWISKNVSCVCKKLENYSSSDLYYGYATCNNPIYSADDGYVQVTLSQPFKFYDKEYSTIYIGTNGYITFDGGSYQYYNIPQVFMGTKMIAVDAGDLVSTIHVCSTSNGVVIRWRGRHYGYSDSVDVQAILYSNGNIKTNLNSVGVITGGWPGYAVTGVSRGDGKYYTSLTTNNNLSYGLLLPYGNYSSIDSYFGYATCNNPIYSADDGYVQVTLSQPFKFYDKEYSTIYIGTNGYITFDGGSYQYYNIPQVFMGTKMIAVDAGDLVSTIHVCSTSNGVVIRWRGRHYGYSDSVDVQAILYSNGNIKTNLNSVGVITGGWPGYAVTGVSRGDGKYYTSLTTNNNLSYVLFKPPDYSVK